MLVAESKEMIGWSVNQSETDAQLSSRRNIAKIDDPTSCAELTVYDWTFASFQNLSYIKRLSMILKTMPFSLQLSSLQNSTICVAFIRLYVLPSWTNCGVHLEQILWKMRKGHKVIDLPFDVIRLGGRIHHCRICIGTTSVSILKVVVRVFLYVSNTRKASVFM